MASPIISTIAVTGGFQGSGPGTLTLSASAGDLVLVYSFAQRATASPPQPPPVATVSGGGLTWTEIAAAASPSSAPFPGDYGRAAVWAAPAPAGLSSATITVSIDIPCDGIEYAGFAVSGAASSPFDANASLPVINLNSPGTPGVMSTSNADDLLFSFLATSGNIGNAQPGSFPPAGWSSLVTATNGAGFFFYDGIEIDYLSVSATQTNLSVPYSGVGGGAGPGSQILLAITADVPSIFVNISESITPQDHPNATVREFVHIAESMTAVDQFNRSMVKTARIVESFIPSEHLSQRVPKKTFALNMAEKALLADIISAKKKQTWNLNVLETVPPKEILDTPRLYNRTILEQAIPADTVSAKAKQIWNLNVLEAVPPKEILDTPRVFNRIVLERIIPADIAQATSRQTLNLTVLEGIPPDASVDNLEATGTANRSVVEQVLLGDLTTATIRQTLNLAVLEAVSLSENVNPLTVFGLNLSDREVIADRNSANTLQTWNLTVLEAVPPGEIANPFDLFNLSVAERQSIADILSADTLRVWNLTTFEGLTLADRILGTGGTTAQWDMLVHEEIGNINERTDVVRIHYTRDIVAVFFSNLLADPAYASFVAPSAALSRLLMLIEIIRAYLAEIGTAHEAKIVQRVLTKFNSAIKAGTDYEAATETTIAVARSLRVLIMHTNAFEDTDQIITPTGGVVNYTSDIVNRFYPTVVSAQYQVFDNAPVWQRLLTIIEVLRGYFIEVQTASEANLAHDVISRMIATIKFGGYLNE